MGKRKSKLLGRIYEMGYTVSSVARSVGVSRHKIHSNINGETCFNTRDISKLCALLKIDKSEIMDYFFD